MRLILLLVDSRHQPTADDILMLNWIRESGHSVIVAATKWDKLSKQQKEENIAIIYNTLNLNPDEKLVPFSAETGEGKEQLWEYIDGIIEQ